MKKITEIKHRMLESFKNGVLSEKPHFFLTMQWNVYNCLRWINARIRRLTFVKKNLLRKCDVVLINLPKHEPLTIFPIGIASLAAYLERNGINVLTVDMNSQFIGKRLLSILISVKKPKIVGLSAITCQANSAYQLGNYLKERIPSTKLVYGGVHPSALPKEPFSKGSADFVVICEGEETLLEVYKSLEGTLDISKIRGLAYKDGNGKVMQNPPRTPINDIDSLPMPAYHLFDVYSYTIDIHIHPYNLALAMDLMTSRGCPHNCSYCSSPFLYKRKVRFRSPEKILEEIEFLIKKYGFKTFHFHDDDFLLNPKRIERLCHLIINKKLDIDFICLTNIDTLINHTSIIPLLKKAGCVGIEFGIESVNKEVLNNINKSQNTKSLLRIANILEKEGITPMYLIMSFNPGETLYSSYETTKMINTLTKGKNINVSYYLHPHHHNHCLGMLTTPYPGSKLYETAKKQGLVLNNDYDYYMPLYMNFVPFSFLNDVPIKLKNLDYRRFVDEISKYKRAILCHVTGRLRIFHGNYDLDYSEYTKFLYELYSLCDGKRSVKTISGVLLKKTGNTSLGYSCIGLRFLAMFGIISSKR